MSYIICPSCGVEMTREFYESTHKYQCKKTKDENEELLMIAKQIFPTTQQKLSLIESMANMFDFSRLGPEVVPEAILDEMMFVAKRVILENVNSHRVAQVKRDFVKYLADGLRLKHILPDAFVEAFKDYGYSYMELPLV